MKIVTLWGRKNCDKNTHPQSPSSVFLSPPALKRKTANDLTCKLFLNEKIYGAWHESKTRQRCIGGGCKTMLAKLNHDVSFGAGEKERKQTRKGLTSPHVLMSASVGLKNSNREQSLDTSHKLIIYLFQKRNLNKKSRFTATRLQSSRINHLNLQWFWNKCESRALFEPCVQWSFLKKRENYCNFHYILNSNTLNSVLCNFTTVLCER